MTSSRASLFPYASGERFQNRPPAEVFREIFQNATWHNATTESISGDGSSLAQTETLVRELPGILKKLGVRSLLDLPCGDFHWMRLAELGDIEYTGADIVEDLVKANLEKHAAPRRNFLALNLMRDPLPAADLLLCRDCLVHLSFRDIFSCLENIRRSPLRYLAATHFPGEPENLDIPTGGWRPLNLRLEPFFFPEPLLSLNENCTEMDGAFSDKSLCVWELARSEG